MHTHGGGLTPLVQASDTDLHQALSPPPSGSVPATKAESPARRVRFEAEPHAVPVPSTPPSPAPSPKPIPTRRWPTAPPKGMAAVAATLDPTTLQAALANLQVGVAADLVTSWTAATSGDHKQSVHDLAVERLKDEKLGPDDGTPTRCKAAPPSRPETPVKAPPIRSVAGPSVAPPPVPRNQHPVKAPPETQRACAPPAKPAAQPACAPSRELPVKAPPG